jgi:hypothetical protein
MPCSHHSHNHHCKHLHSTPQNKARNPINPNSKTSPAIPPLATHHSHPCPFIAHRTTQNTTQNTILSPHHLTIPNPSIKLAEPVPNTSLTMTNQILSASFPANNHKPAPSPVPIPNHHTHSQNPYCPFTINQPVASPYTAKLPSAHHLCLKHQNPKSFILTTNPCWLAITQATVNLSRDHAAPMPSKPRHRRAQNQSSATPHLLPSRSST